MRGTMDENSVNPKTSTVLIVGAGPTGMTAALELSRLHIPVRIVEKMAAPAPSSRAVGVHARTMELFEQRGLAQSMLEKGNQGIALSYYAQGKRVFRLQFSHNSSDYSYILLISQAETESILRNALEKQGVEIEREVEFVAFSQSDRDANSGHAVKAILKHKDGSLEGFDCAYLLDTEGAHSLCRTTMDVQFKGRTREENYALGDLQVDGGDLAETDSHVFSSEYGVLAMFPLRGDRYRIVAANSPSASSKSPPSLDELQKIFDQRSHFPARLHDLTWSSRFRINSRMVDRLRVGRVLFGGDSAHIHSPAGGQGMNTGIQDMINLSWKLAFVLKGKADPKLLDTYTDDRIPVIRDVLSRTEGLTDVMGSKNRTFRSVFSLITPWVLGVDIVQRNATEIMSQLALNYRSSPISASHGKKISGREIQAGDRIPNIKKVKVVMMVIGKEGEETSESEHESLFSVLSSDKFTLLFANLTKPKDTYRSVESTFAPWKSFMQVYSVAPTSEQDQLFRRVFGTESSLLLARPDSYVAFVGTEQSLDALAKYLNSWFPVEKQTDQHS
ncbi:unnamed protein product [Calypogeia fissa]